MKAILVGLGDFGSGWLDVLRRNKDVMVAGIVDKNKALLKKHGTRAHLDEECRFTDPAIAISATKPDFLVNATPPKNHKEVNLAAFREKIPVLCEKPIAENMADALAIYRAAKKAKVSLMIAENYRFASSVRRAHKLLFSGVIGKRISLQIDFQRNHSMTNYHKDLEHPMFLDVGVHHMDMIRYLTGSEVLRVYARAFTPPWSSYKGYSTVQALFETKNNIKVAYHASLSSFKSETDFYGNWRFEGGKGLLYLSGAGVKVITPTQTTIYKSKGREDSREEVLREFLNSLRAKKKSETDISDNIQSYAIVMGGIESIRKNKIIKIKNWR